MPQAGSVTPTGVAGHRARWQWLIPLLLVVAGLAAFHNSFDGAFQLDDEHAIVNNLKIRQLWPPSLAMSDTTRPVARYSFAVNYAAGGTNPWGYHAVNLAIHVLAGLALFGIVRRTLGSGKLADRYGQAAPWLAGAAAALWLVHPLQTESVTYIVQRDESLMGLAFLLTLYCSIRAWGSPHAGRWSIAAVVACALGMGTKEVMVTAPVLVVLYDRAFVFGSLADALRRRWPLYLGLAATWLVLAALLLQGGEQWTRNLASDAERITVPEYALSEPGVILHYLRLSLWPQPLVLDYKWPVASTVAAIAPGAVVVAALLAGTIVALWRRPALGFLGAWFFVILAPTSSIVPIADLAFEHRMYLPLAAIAVAAVIGLHELSRVFERWLAPAGNASGWAEAGVVILAVVALSIVTVRRNDDYRSPLAMWSDVVAKRPANPRGHNNLGTRLAAQGNHDEAMAEYREALRLKPDYADAHFNVGALLVAQGKTGAEALAHLSEAIRLNPSHPDAHMSLGVVLADQGRTDEAAAQFQQAVRLKPDFAEAHSRLGLALTKQGKADAAAAHFREAIRLKPDYVEARLHLGALLTAQGRSDEARTHYAAAARAEPGSEARAHFESGNALDRQGRPLEAIAEYREALRLKPDYVDALNNLGGILIEQRRPAEAVPALSEAVRLRPDFVSARNNLGAALFAQGKVAEAIVQLSAAAQLTPDSATAHYNLARALARAGQVDAAIDHFGTAARLDPANARLRYDFATALARQGQLDAATAQYSEALRINPNFTEAKSGRDAALARAGKPPTAR